MDRNRQEWKWARTNPFQQLRAQSQIHALQWRTSGNLSHSESKTNKNIFYIKMLWQESGNWIKKWGRSQIFRSFAEVNLSPALKMNEFIIMRHRDNIRIRMYLRCLPQIDVCCWLRLSTPIQRQGSRRKMWEICGLNKARYDREYLPACTCISFVSQMQP